MKHTHPLRHRWWVPVVALSLLGGCISAQRRMPTVSELTRRDPEADPEQLQVGRTLVITECTACHRQYWPHEYGAKAWARIARNMGRRASLGPDQTEAVRAYMTRSAEAVGDDPTGDDPTGDGGSGCPPPVAESR